MKRFAPKLLFVLPAAMMLGGCVAVPYDPYYSAPVAYPAYPSYPAYPAYSTYPDYAVPYSSFYFGYGWGGGGGRWRR